MNQREVWNSIAEDWNKFRVKTVEEVKEFLKNKKTCKNNFRSNSFNSSFET